MVVRDAIWRVGEVSLLEDGRQMISLLPPGGNGRGALTIVSPPEIVEPATAVYLALDNDDISPLGPHHLATARSLRRADCDDPAIQGQLTDMKRS